jgi:hypothetical protein
MTTNLYLNNLLSPICDTYGGCYSCDNIPDIGTNTEINFIVNLSKVSEPGSHFVVLIIKKHFIYFFDSFGHKCMNAHILAYMAKLSRNIVYNSVKIQDFDSKMCGFYCALMILRNDKNCTMKSDLRFHTDNAQLQLNDKLCVTYICKTLKTWQQK